MALGVWGLFAGISMFRFENAREYVKLHSTLAIGVGVCELYRWAARTVSLHPNHVMGPLKFYLFLY